MENQSDSEENQYEQDVSSSGGDDFKPIEAYLPDSQVRQADKPPIVSSSTKKIEEESSSNESDGSSVNEPKKGVSSQKEKGD